MYLCLFFSKETIARLNVFLGSPNMPASVVSHMYAAQIISSPNPNM